VPASEPTLLILGGTAEARALADALLSAPLRVLSSLAGRTADAQRPSGDVRIGGFGGVAGLAETLRSEAVDAVIDATHPFATRISANAVAACTIADVPRLVLARPAWRRRPGDRWHEVPDVATAARTAARLGARLFVTVGAQELKPFARLKGCRLVVRVVDRPRQAPPRAIVIAARGPFTLAGERALMRRHRIDVLVTKASGGAATAAKLDAARTLGLPVVVVRRPPPPPGPRVADVAGAVAWACATLGLDPGAPASLTELLAHVADGSRR